MFLNDFFKNARGIWRQFWALGAVCLGLAANPAAAQQSWGSFSGPEVAARSAVLMNADTGELLYAREPHLRLPPASTTKVLTAMVVLEQLNPNARLQTSFQAASAVPSRIGLRAGEMASTQDLLYGLMLKSGNDAAETLAEGAGGSVYSFSSLMNAKAWQLGARNSHFTNPHGLPDDDHYSTAYDLALIFRQAMKYPLFADIVGTRSAMLRIESGQAPFGDSRFVPVANHNRLLLTYEGALGGKTGFTQKARRCFVGEVSRGGVRLIVSILNSPSSRTLWQDAQDLLDYGFARYGLAPQPAQPVFENQPVMVRGAPAITPDAERLAALSSRAGFSSRFAPAELEPIKVRAPLSAPSTANPIIAGSVPATNPTSKRAISAQSASEEDEEPLVWSGRASAADGRKLAYGTQRKAAAAASKPAAEPLVWTRRATAADSQEFEPASSKQPEPVAAVNVADDPNVVSKPLRKSEPVAAAKATHDSNVVSEPLRKSEPVATTKAADEPLVWTRRATATDVDDLDSPASVKSRTPNQDDGVERALASAEAAHSSDTTGMIVDRPAVRWVDEEQERTPSRVKKQAVKSAQSNPAPKAVASATKPANPIKVVAGPAKAQNSIKLAAAATPSKSLAPAKVRETGTARLADKPSLSSAKAKLKGAAGEAKGQDTGKQAKTSQSSKTSTVAVKPDKGANAKVIARAEPSVVKLPQKNVKRRI